jgi:hypothetical protein
MGTVPERRFSDWVTVGGAPDVERLAQGETCRARGDRPAGRVSDLDGGGLHLARLDDVDRSARQELGDRQARGPGARLSVDALVLEREDRDPLHEVEVELGVGELGRPHRAAAAAEARDREEEGQDRSAEIHVRPS